ncbi:hypothetical protein MNBD_GAMMA03-250 [hydrothermal vent metagenome]|uniref:Uncharacterized protein n=1 Tax=hydrothermal vent metagenome TaxID=652676 RepID=A0A3B0VQU8_9ZZZZ
MQNKVTIIIILLIIVSFYLLYKPDQNLVTQPEMPDKHLEPYNKSDTEAKTEQTVTTKPKQGIDEPAETYPAIYDSDPVVDANLIITRHSMCYNYLSDEYGNVKTAKELGRFERLLDKKQLQYHKKYYQYCQQLNQQHPEYKLTNLSAMQKQLSSAEPSSLWGKIIKGEVKAESLNAYEINDLLKQNSLAILSQAPKHLRHYYNQVIHWDLEDILQNHQYDYVKQIQQYAHQLYLCNLGADCSPNSSVLAMLCYLSSHSCGLNYEQYISQVLTPGQQADIQLTMGYLRNKYSF